MHYFPITAAFVLLFLFFLVLAFVAIEIGIIEYAYERIGIERRYIFSLLLLSLFGSYINIPIGEVPGGTRVEQEIVRFFGMAYVVPVVTHTPHTIVAINLGGAVIPTVVSVYLTFKQRLFFRAGVAVAIVAVITHLLAYPVRGVGIAVPIFVPPAVAAIVAVVLCRHRAPALAYVGGSLGTLIGADLLNLDKVAGLGAPVASIGGAGTFDGVFLSGILAALLA